MSSQTLIDRTPPQDIEAEAAVLGSILIDNECAGDVVQVLSQESFYRRAHSVIFQALVALYDSRRALDMVTLRDEMERRGTLEDAGGIEYLTQLADAVPSAANAVEYAMIVSDKALLRSLISTCTGIVRDAYDGRERAEDVVDASEQRIFELAEKRVGGNANTILEILKRTMANIESYQTRRGQYTGIPSGYHDLDKLTGGFQGGEMIIVAARPSMGKTTLALNMVKRIAMDEGHPVAVFSMEMSEQMLAQNLLCMEAEIDSSKLRSGFLSDAEFEKLGEALGPLSEAPIFIDDTPVLSILQLRAKARRLAARHKIRMVMVDYLQLMGAAGYDSRQQEISAISRGIKALARELDIPIMALCQLNRSAETREGHRPRLADLRESGALEQDADVVILLHRPDYYTGQAEEGPGAPPPPPTELIIAKQRNGPTGVAKLTFRKECMKFEAYTEIPAGF